MYKLRATATILIDKKVARSVRTHVDMYSRVYFNVHCTGSKNRAVDLATVW